MGACCVKLIFFNGHYYLNVVEHPELKYLFSQAYFEYV